MADADLTVAILREIRDGIHGTNERLDATNERLDETNERLDATRIELKTELTQTNARLAVVEDTLKDLGAQLLMLVRYVGNVVDRHEQAIDDLRERMVRLESRVERP